MNPFIESQRNVGQTPINGRTSQPNNPMQMMQDFKSFMQTFKGNPEAQVKQMLSAGQINQNDLNNAISQANQFKSMLGM